MIIITVDALGNRFCSFGKQYKQVPNGNTEDFAAGNRHVTLKYMEEKVFASQSKH